jgi:hypothetical protein
MKMNFKAETQNAKKNSFSILYFVSAGVYFFFFFYTVACVKITFLFCACLQQDEVQNNAIVLIK